jgi:uncharacterized membrane protein
VGVVGQEEEEPQGVGNMNILSLIHNLFVPDFFLTRAFSKVNLQEIQQKISESEKSTAVQIVFAYQAHKKLIDSLNNVSARDLAVKEFARLGVWDTEENTGILFYLLLADKQFEIVADRGIEKFISEIKWQEITFEIEKCLKTMPLNEAVLKGIELIRKEVKTSFPASSDLINEMEDTPIKIR